MTKLSLAVLVTTGILALSCAAAMSLGQTKDKSEGIEQRHLVLSKLSSPTYPPLARQARIAGDVELEVRIRQDGSIDSVKMVSGHPMLGAAALESAKKSQFECRNCSGEVAGYSLVYTFALVVRENSCEPSAQSPATDRSVFTGVTESENHVTVIAEPPYICDPVDQLRKVRSAKCVYLWKCARQ